MFNYKFFKTFYILKYIMMLYSVSNSIVGHLGRLWISCVVVSHVTRFRISCVVVRHVTRFWISCVVVGHVTRFRITSVVVRAVTCLWISSVVVGHVACLWISSVVVGHVAGLRISSVVVGHVACLRIFCAIDRHVTCCWTWTLLIYFYQVINFLLDGLESWLTLILHSSLDSWTIMAGKTDLIRHLSVLESPGSGHLWAVVPTSQSGNHSSVRLVEGPFIWAALVTRNKTKLNTIST